MSASNDRYKWQLLGVVMIGTLMAALDTSIVNISIPSIMADFASNLDDIEWVMTGYMLAFAVFMPLTAWFRPIVGAKKLYIGSLILFIVGSLFCGMAFNLESLIVARVLQAIGGGGVTPTGMVMISEVFAPHERGKAMGLWGVGIIMGPAVGPTLGGLLTHYWGWRWIFLVNLPIGILGIFLSYMILREEKGSWHAKKFDFWGLFFFSLFLVALLLGLTKGESEGWTSHYIVMAFSLALFGFLAFVATELWVEHPVIDLSLFASPLFSLACIVMLFRSVALFGSVFLLPLLLQRQMGFDEIESGLIMFPGALVVAMFMPIGGILNDKMGPLVPTVIGLIGGSVSLLLYHDIQTHSTLWAIIYPTFVRGLGMGLLGAPITATAINSVPKEKTGVASSVMNILQQVGGSLGIAILGTVLANRMHFHLNILSSSMSSENPLLRFVGRQLAIFAHQHGANYKDSFKVAQVALSKHIASEASIMAFRDTFIFGGLLVSAVIILALFLPHHPFKHHKPEQV